MRGTITTTLGVTAAVLLTLSSTAAQASDYRKIHGTMGGDDLRGTTGSDLIGGRAGDDRIRPGRGADIVRAAGGDDYIFLLNDGVVDRIHCGAGRDVVAYSWSVDQHDIIDPNCEGIIA